MSWVDNLESDLSTSSNDQPGPSGVTTTLVQEIKFEGRNKLENENDPNCTDQIIPQDEQLPEKKKTPIQIFVERVTIAGLEEAYQSKWRIKEDTIMFRLALLAALLMIIYETYVIIGQHTNQSTVFDDTLMTNEKAIFPHFSICFPTSFNESRLNEILASRNKTTYLASNNNINLTTVLPKKTIDLMRKNNITLAVVIDFFKQALLLNVQADDGGTPLYLIAAQAYNAMLWEGINPFELWIPTCSQVLSNCAFGGRSFDCCSAAKFLTLQHLSCYQINISAIAGAVSTNNSADSMSLDSTGLTFDISADWTSGLYQDGVGSDGFPFFVDTLPTMNGDPAIIPAYMSAVINLAQPRKISEITHCLPTSKIPVLKNFDYYDSNGIHCKWEMFNDMFSRYLSCRESMLSYFSNESCSFNQQFVFALAMSGSKPNNLLRSAEEKINALQEDLHKDILLTHSGRVCKPLCSRWSYRVLSASYGLIQYGDSNDVQKRRDSNQSWSRIRILMQDAAPWSRVEQRKASPYLAVCDIGGMMGVYAGFSMVTFGQIVGYGAFVAWSWLKRKRRVSPEQQTLPLEQNVPVKTLPVIKVNYCAKDTVAPARQSVNRFYLTDKEEINQSRFVTTSL